MKNGNWEKQQSHLLSFENPCITDSEFQSANLSSTKKDFGKNPVIGKDLLMIKV